MKVTIVGAGAIGGVVGAFLARTGTDVTVVDVVAEHVPRIRERGLEIRTKRANHPVPVKACTPVELVGAGRPLEWVFLAVKGQDTRRALEPLLPLLTPESTVVSLQKGLCDREVAAMIGAERTIGCQVPVIAAGEAAGLDLTRTRLLKECIRTNRRMSMGSPEIRQFEEAAAKDLDVKHAFAVTSCGTGLDIATQAIGIEEGDEVITTAITYQPTAVCVARRGGRPDAAPHPVSRPSGSVGVRQTGSRCRAHHRGNSDAIPSFPLFLQSKPCFR